MQLKDQVYGNQRNLPFEKYLYQDDAILDIGCGTGRTTLAPYKKRIPKYNGNPSTSDMLNEAEKIAHEYNLDIPFIHNDATNLLFNDSSFEKAFFAFNGLMQIPQQKNENQLNFREQEEMIWCGGKQDERLYEFGDILISGKTLQEDTYLHPYPSPT